MYYDKELKLWREKGKPPPEAAAPLPPPPISRGPSPSSEPPPAAGGPPPQGFGSVQNRYVNTLSTRLISQIKDDSWSYESALAPTSKFVIIIRHFHHHDTSTNPKPYSMLLLWPRRWMGDLGFGAASFRLAVICPTILDKMVVGQLLPIKRKGPKAAGRGCLHGEGLQV
jgi:hypothetical protein